MATFTLAQKLDNMGDLTGAARTYAEYEQNFPDADQVADALFNQIRIADKQGNSAQVVQLATRYAQQFPNGNDLAKVRRLLAKAEGGAKPSDSATGELPKSSVDDPDETVPVEPAVPAQR
jgi:TolA-binding protein